MKTLMLSDEEYNILKNSKTPEELWSIKDSLMNSDTLLKYHDKKYVILRCLSSNEHNKYIINGTADGSIIANNINVWHYNNTGTTYNFAAMVNAGYYTGILSSVSNPIFLPVVSGTNSTCNASYTLGCSELLSDNITNLASSYGQPYTVNVYTAYEVPRYGVQSGKATTNLSALAKPNKTSTIYSIVANKPIINGNAVHNTTATWVTVNLQIHQCFRPIFQFIDNNKSINLYN